MELQAPQPDCIIKIEAIGCCENCAKRVREKIVRLEGVHSVEIDRERRWVYIAGDIELQSLMTYLTRRSVKPQSVKLIYYCSKEARNDKHHAKNQTEYTPMENKNHESHVKDNLPKETYCHDQNNMASDHAKNTPSNDNCPMQNNSKREGGNYNQDSSHHHTRSDYDPNHYAPRKDWVHVAENYVAQPQKQDQHPSVDCGCRNPSCDFHGWKRQGSSSGSRFDFDRVPMAAAHMRSASARWLREELPPPFYGYHEPIIPIPRLPGQFPYI
ncbi:uncharacterized protein LOC132029570 [Lycium ferocissimum]|uniref:uncharacterized protein LOC132029570 n=1 Tax=Lycium ferocissimum TaxID=112874 RepID=UPI002816977B|nr:uncharacterized protein LOC132029570 [Lycium ferocissimum]